MKPEENERISAASPPVVVETTPLEGAAPKEEREPVPEIEDQLVRRLIIDEAALRKKKIDQLVFDIWMVFLAIGVCLAISPLIEGEAGEAIERLIGCCLFGSLVSGIAMIAYGWSLRPTDDTTVAEELERRASEKKSDSTGIPSAVSEFPPSTASEDSITTARAADVPRTGISE
jgi:hypothetical protein